MEIRVFTDGACTKNGRTGAKAGYGVYFPDKEIDDISEAFTISPITNQRAELYAIYTALNSIFSEYSDIARVSVYSDSNYSIRCVTEWINNWKKNNWRTSNRKPVKNVDIIRKIDRIIQSNPNIIKFYHVRSHTGKTDPISVGNDIADKLATNGIINF